MSGGGGHVILDNTRTTLTNPLVSGALPPATQALIAPILAADPSTWTARNKKDLAAAYTWALMNCT
jgi:hypothetical protein